MLSAVSSEDTLFFSFFFFLVFSYHLKSNQVNKAICMEITSQRTNSGIFKDCRRTEVQFSICNCEVTPKLAGEEKNSVLEMIL